MSNSEPISVAFVCMGNICRSPMAEAVFSDIVKENNLESLILSVDSYGTHAYHIGETPDSRTVSTCKKHKVPVNHRAQKIKREHFNEFDYVLCMDEANLRNLLGVKPNNSKAVVSLFGKWKVDENLNEIVDDPYYGGSDGFETCYKQCVHFTKIFLKTELGIDIS